MNAAEREALIAAATTAHRTRDHTQAILPNAAWCDLDADGREQAFQETAQLRAMEAALDPEGLSTTARAVLARIQR